MRVGFGMHSVGLGLVLLFLLARFVIIMGVVIGPLMFFDLLLVTCLITLLGLFYYNTF